MALVRTGSGTAPGADASPAELTGRVLAGSGLQPADSMRLPARAPTTPPR